MARAIWSGSISFGLVNIPVKVYSAVRDRDIHFHMLSEDGSCRLRRRLVCPDTGKEYDFGETAKGVEIAPDQYVLVSPDEIEAIRPDRGKTIEIERFVAIDEIDPMLFDRPYYLLPEKSGSKPYRLLLEALERSLRVAVARFVLRTKEHLVVVRPIGEHLCLETLRFADEVVPPEQVGDAPRDVEFTDREEEMADQLIEHLTTSFDAEEFRDIYRERLQELIDAKASGQELVVQETSAPESGRVANLMEALQRSLQAVEERKDESPRSGGRAARRRKATTPKKENTPAKKRTGSKSGRPT